MSAVHLVVFSKARPLQLHGYLTSLFVHWGGEYRVDVLVLAEPPYDAAYRRLQGEFPGVGWCWQTDFAGDLLDLLAMGGDPHPYTCFGTDDVVFTAPVDVADVHAAFGASPALLGYSLRLGEHTDADMFGRAMPPPVLTRLREPAFDPYVYQPRDRQVIGWDVGAGAGDWGYPWEVLGTVYPTDYVRATVAALVAGGQVRNPSTLEDAGWRRWRECAGGRHLFYAYTRARLVVPTVNVVQSVFGNGIVGPAGLEAGFLLDCWTRGLRLDVDRFRGMTPPSWRIPDFFLRRAG